MGQLNSYELSTARFKQDPDALLGEFNAQNQFAFRFIFESYYRSAVLFAEGVLNAQSEHTEDIVQDAFIKLWSSTTEFKDINQIKSFIYVTVKNACIDQSRQSKVADKYQGHAQRQQQMLEAGFIEPLISAETTRLINEAIEALPEQGRNVFKMSLSGLKNDEIAERLNISVNTVKTHKQRALASLRLSLGDAMLILLLLYHNNLIK